ncbi:MAG: hypothetical protein H6737_15070 [Alphaproteobacteria bacterium]|nr:hypothetical protein [Alphaproteobacteria bacterium]
MSALQRLFRHPRIARHFPARFRTTAEQDLAAELRGWLRDQLDPEGRAFDRAHGVSTTWFDLGNYEPTPPTVIHDVLGALPGDPTRFAFVDLGSGKGRVVLVAAGRPFRRVVGIERGRMLSWRARRNARAYTGPVLTTPEWVCADVRVAPLPDGPLVLFAYNPFGTRVMEAVLARTIDREVVLAAVNPLPQEQLEGLGFALHAAHRHPVDDRRWAIFTRGPRP